MPKFNFFNGTGDDLKKIYHILYIPANHLQMMMNILMLDQNYMIYDIFLFSTDLLFQSAEEFGISKEEARVILTELKETLGFACAKMLKKMQGEDTTTFGV